MNRSSNPNENLKIWVVIAILALLTFILGIYGFADAYNQELPTTLDRMSGTIYEGSLDEVHIKSYSILDYAYASLQLFVFQSGAQVPIDNQALEVARFVAPLLTLSSLLIIFWLLMDRIRIATLIFKPGHIVICGCGYLGLALVHYYLDKKSTVVVIENNPDNPDLDKVSRSGATVIIGDASDPIILRRAKTFLASEVYLVTGNDDKNAEISILCRNILPEFQKRRYKFINIFHNPGILTCHIHLENDLLSRTIALTNTKLDYKLGEDGKRIIKMEYFNLYRIAGYCAQKTGPGPFTETELSLGIHPHIIIIGFGRMGRSLFIQTVRRWKLNYSEKKKHKIIVTIISRDAAERLDEIYAWYPTLKDYCEIHPLNYESSALEYNDLNNIFLNIIGNSRPPTRVYLCIDNSSKAVSLALLLVENLGLHTIPIIVRSLYEDGITNVIKSFRKSNTYRNIHPFPIVGSTCCMNMITGGGMREILAKIIYRVYLEDMREKEGLKEHSGNLTSPEWHDLSEDEKEEYRLDADAILKKVGEIKCAVAPIIYWDDSLFSADSDQIIEELAEKEHERWCKEKIELGYVLGEIRDDEAKTTPWLIPYNGLPDKEKEKDREQVRKIPELLEKANLRIVRDLFDFRYDLAKKIHQNYVEKRKQDPDVDLSDIALKSWDQLSDTLKESNLDQAENFENLIGQLGYKIVYTTITDQNPYEFPEDEVEKMARLEHDRWVAERLNAGWIYGEIKDVDNKKSPYLVPYDDLSEEIKDYDREPVRNLPKLLESIGLGIIRKENK